MKDANSFLSLSWVCNSGPLTNERTGVARVNEEEVGRARAMSEITDHFSLRKATKEPNENSSAIAESGESAILGNSEQAKILFREAIETMKNHEGEKYDAKPNGGEPSTVFEDKMNQHNDEIMIKGEMIFTPAHVKLSIIEDSARIDMQRCQSMEEYSKASEASVFPANHERPEPDAIEFAQRRAKLEGKRE